MKTCPECGANSVTGHVQKPRCSFLAKYVFGKIKCVMDFDSFSHALLQSNLHVSSIAMEILSESNWRCHNFQLGTDGSERLSSFDLFKIFIALLDDTNDVDKVSAFLHRIAN